MKRDILNHLGDVIGELELPDGTSEEIWTKELAKYSIPPARLFPSITPRQIRLAMVAQGLALELIDQAIETLPNPEKETAKIEWEYAVSFERSHPLVNSLGASFFGWTEEQLDDLWIFASTL